MTPEKAVLGAIVLCCVGAALSLVVSRAKLVAGWLSFGIVSLSAGLVLSAVWSVLLHGAQPPAQFLQLPGLGFSLRIHVDGLSAVFLLLAAIVAVPAGLYSIHYLLAYPEDGAGRYYPYFLLFLAAMYGLLSTTDMMWFFFIFWQLMTWPGYALIRYERRNPQNVQAANRYLLMMQIACAATMVGAWFLAVASPAGAPNTKYDFPTISNQLPLLLQTKPFDTGVAFALFLVGFGIKMGMWPFGQFWLPEAHPAAPSPVSAMLSGVMIKTGVYGLMRYFLWLVPASALPDFALGQWGAVIALLGTATLLTGTAQALQQEQSKRLLAFHSIGQIGYILLGTGACMILLAAPPLLATRALAALALFGALFHVLNHGIFKALLFFNAGSMLHATGTQDLNQMGGLMKPMPVTAVTAIVASLSISGVPLFNGFVSKWSIYAATFQGARVAPYLALCGVLAILTSALTLASFIKFFGGSFLSRTSTRVQTQLAARNKLEVDSVMQVPQLFLAALCLGLGLFPFVAYRLICAALAASSEGLGKLVASAPRLENSWLGLANPQGACVLSPVVLLVVLAGAFALVRFASKLGGAPRRISPPWLCGYAQEAECHRYGAHQFYGEIKRRLRWFKGAPQLAGEHEQGKAS